MATVTQYLQIIKDCFNDIKQSIINKGGTISGNITTYASAISNIPNSGNSSESTLNYDGIPETYNNAHQKRITHLTIKEGVTELSNYDGVDIGAFEYCSIESVNLPSTLQRIGRYAFRGTMLQKVIIPNSVTVLDGYCFSDTQNLKYVVMPNRLNTIYGEGEFKESSVQHIYFNNAEIIPSIGYNGMLFAKVFLEHTKIIVPDNLYDSWRDTDGWSVYADQIYKASEYPIPNE